MRVEPASQARVHEGSYREWVGTTDSSVISVKIKEKQHNKLAMRNNASERCNGHETALLARKEAYRCIAIIK